ncbi:MAG: hypothetical protein DSZ10_01290 [Sulfurovum sp.]|nr:MAG: hypothetical protein DSZ10_01290 [Sulfurovum sp.]
MLRAFVNLFLSLLFPLVLLFGLVATLYYLKESEISIAIKLGVITGTLVAIGSSAILALLIMLKRFFQMHRYERLHTQSQNTHQTQGTYAPEPISQQLGASPEDAERLMLLMDYDVAYEVALYAIESQKLGIIQKADKKQGEIIIQQKGRYIPLKLSRLSPHTAQMIVTGMENINVFIQAVKEKEFSFLNYH